MTDNRSGDQLTDDTGNIGFEVTAEAGTITSCTVTNKAPVTAWTMEKTSDTDGTVNPGDTISYTVEASNTGEETVDGITFRDDLSDVLDDATFVSGSAKLVVDGGAAWPSRILPVRFSAQARSASPKVPRQLCTTRSGSTMMPTRQR